MRGSKEFILSGFRTGKTDARYKKKEDETTNNIYMNVQRQNHVKIISLKSAVLVFLGILILIHLYIAGSYYFINEAKLSRFFIIQTDIEPPTN